MKNRASGYLITMRADHSAAIGELKAKRLPIHERMEELQALADAEKRDLNADELKEFESCQKRFDSISAQIKRREMLAGNGADLDKLDERISGGMPKPTPGVSPGRSVIPEGQHGFTSIGDFALAVKASARQGAQIDNRILAALPTNYGNEQTPADGGFVIPPDFRPAIVGFMFSQESLLSRTDQNTTPVDSMSFPKDETTPWSGGIQVYWTAARAR